MKINDVMLKEYEEFARHAFNKLNGKIDTRKFFELIIAEKTKFNRLNIVLCLESIVQGIISRNHNTGMNIDKLDYIIKFAIVKKLIRMALDRKYYLGKAEYNIQEYIRNVENREVDNKEVISIIHKFLEKETYKYLYELKDFIRTEIICTNYDMRNTYFSTMEESKYSSLIEKRPLDDYYHHIIYLLTDYDDEMMNTLVNEYDKYRVVFVLHDKNNNRKRLLLKDKGITYDHYNKIYNYLYQYIIKEESSMTVKIDTSAYNKIFLVVCRVRSEENGN